ncbi:hypothetical protein MNBD_ALPHA12-1277 [hydrothermal vent metagenome]|uniref:Malate dehydrogenase n=1 Tax=hydrothermal vent metagenome TaxID=652676 RepID=A0A3B0U5N4_9ZZZZ
MSQDQLRIAEKEAEKFARQLLMAHDVDERQAAFVASNAVWNEMVGRHNFGFERFDVYIKRLVAKGINPHANPHLKQNGETVALIDGDNGFGQYAAAIAIKAAIKMAKQTGVGVVAVHNSNFFGTGAYFVQQAAKSSMISMAMSNSFAKVAAHNGLLPVLGTNPFAFGAPRQNGESLLVDIATSALAGSSVRQYAKQGQKLPEGFAIDSDGKAITEPQKVKTGALLPFAGPKGFCMALMVEILAGILSGAAISKGVKSIYNELDQGGGNGHFMLAIDIGRFMPLADYFERMENLLALIKQSGDGTREILLPGQIRWRNYFANQKAGLALDNDLAAKLEELALDAGVVAPWQATANTKTAPS